MPHHVCEGTVGCATPYTQGDRGQRRTVYTRGQRIVPLYACNECQGAALHCACEDDGEMCYTMCKDDRWVHAQG